MIPLIEMPSLENLDTHLSCKITQNYLRTTYSFFSIVRVITADNGFLNSTAERKSVHLLGHCKSFGDYSLYELQTNYYITVNAVEIITHDTNDWRR